MSRFTELPDDSEVSPSFNEASPSYDEASGFDDGHVYDTVHEGNHEAVPAISGPSRAEVETKTLDELIQDFQRTPLFMTDIGDATDTGMRNIILANCAIHDH
jgi:hypothetical protein